MTNPRRRKITTASVTSFAAAATIALLICYSQIAAAVTIGFIAGLLLLRVALFPAPDDRGNPAHRHPLGRRDGIKDLAARCSRTNSYVLAEIEDDCATPEINRLSRRLSRNDRRTGRS